MGQIIGSAAKPKRCNLNQLSQFGTPAAGEYILVSSDNSMNAAGQGNFDCYIEGNGTDAATALELKPIADKEATLLSKNSVTSDSLFRNVSLNEYFEVETSYVDGLRSASPSITTQNGDRLFFYQVKENEIIKFSPVFTSGYARVCFTSDMPAINVATTNFVNHSVESLSGSSLILKSPYNGYFCFSLTISAITSVKLETKNTYLGSFVKKIEEEKISYEIIDGTNTENVIDNAYINYSTGAKTTASAYHNYKMRFFPCDGLIKIVATLGFPDSVPAAIAFYSSDININTSTIGEYMKSSSLQASAGTKRYEADVPTGAKYVCVTNRYETLSEPIIQLFKSPFNDSTQEENILYERNESSVSEAIAQSVDLSNVPVGTQLKIEVTELGGESNAYIMIYHGGTTPFYVRNFLSIFETGDFYIEVLAGVTKILLRKDATSGNVFNFKVVSTKSYTIRNRVIPSYIAGKQKTLELGDLFSGYYSLNSHAEEDITVDPVWVSYPLQTNCGGVIRIDADFETYYVRVNVWKNGLNGYDTNAVLQETTDFDTSGMEGWNVQFRRIDRGVITPESVADAVSITYVSGTIYERPMVKGDVIKMLESANINPEAVENAKKIAGDGYAKHIFSNAPYYYHYAANDFVRDGNGNKAIASESVEDIALAARLGFAFIEANIQPTSDGKYVCIHGSSGAFGPEVKSVNENVITTESLRSTAINSVTQAWIRENVRYDSYYSKYQTPIPTLEEFCEACKENNIGIFAGTSQKTAIDTCVKYLGNNVIVYGAPNNVRNYFNGYVYSWNNTSGLTISALLNVAKSFGSPYVCALGPTTISEFESDGILDDFISTMHANGFLCGFASVYQTEEETRDLIRRGFDMSGSGHEVNSFDSNYEEFDVDDANHLPTTTGSISNGVITLASGQTITCGSTNVISVGKGNLFIRFNGTLSINFGSKGNRGGLTSDGTQMLNISDYFFGRSTQIIITAGANTTITHFFYKTSRC